jgi:hypothetical protein
MARTCIQSALGRAQVPCATGWPGCGTRASRRTIAHWKGPRSARRFQHRLRAGVAGRVSGPPPGGSGARLAPGRRGAPGGGRSAGNSKPGKRTFRKGARRRRGRRFLEEGPPHGAPGGGRKGPAGRRAGPAAGFRRVETGKLRRGAFVCPRPGPGPPGGRHYFNQNDRQLRAAGRAGAPRS